ncbi:MAG TPA: hypothetical protein VGG19_07730 [Tepidisphaeraceae bacterium]
MILGENDFRQLDAWAQNLKLEDGRPLNKSRVREERMARSVGRPTKPDSIKSRRIMISMTPTLARAAGSYAKKSGYTLSGLIAESLMEKIKRKAS